VAGIIVAMAVAGGANWTKRPFLLSEVAH